MAGDGEPREAIGTRKTSEADREKERQILTKLKAGTMKLYELEKELPPVDAVRVRREFIGQVTHTTLEQVGTFSIDIGRVVQRNCENMIGTVQVPLGAVSYTHLTLPDE